MYSKFKVLLTQHNVTIYRVAKETGISEVTLYDWKNGKYTPKLDKLKRIADYFGISITYFID